MGHKRRLLAAVGLLAAGAGAWELQRRRDLRAVRSDPEWDELSRPVRGRPLPVLSADGTELHAEVFGDESLPAVVLVHGWMETLEVWQRVVRDLSGRYRVIAYDQRGHGRSQVPDDATSYTEESLADDLEAVLSTCLRPRERCVIAGHSMGGMTVVAWCGRHRDQVQQLLAGAVLVNTGMHELVGRLLVLGPLVGAPVHKAVAPRVMSLYRPLTTELEPISLRIVRRIVGGQSSSPAQVAFYHRMFLSCPAPVRTGFGRLFTTLDLRESIAAVTIPSVVIAGHDDKLLPPWHSQQLADALPQLREHVELERMGHMVPVEAPHTVTASIRHLAERELHPHGAPAAREAAHSS